MTTDLNDGCAVRRKYKINVERVSDETFLVFRSNFGSLKIEEPSGRLVTC